MRGVLEALVTMDLQLCSDIFFFPGFFDRAQYKVNILFCAGFVCDDTVVVQISDDGQIQESLSCLDV